MRTETAIVGRVREVEAIEVFLEDARRGFAALCLEGEPGIGKSTLWELALDHAAAAGARVLRCRPASAEQSMTLGALADLLRTVYEEVTGRLPAVQADAIGAALGMRDGTADARVLSLGVTGAFRSLAEQGPVVVAVDDSQWLDASSASLLAYALRRLDDQPIGFVIARRAGDDDRLGLRDRSVERAVRFLRVGPLDQDALAILVRNRLDITLPRPALDALLNASGGNPFYALEIARATSPTDLALGKLGDLPSSLRSLVQERLSVLSDLALEVVLVAAASPKPTVALLRSVIGGATRVEDGLAEAEEAEILTSAGGTIRFLHPLLASTVYTTTAAARRRELHRRLADGVDDDEERGHHLARAAVGTDGDAAAALELAAQSAARRGGSADAARLADEAVALTPPGDVAAVRERLFAAAGYHFESGAALAAKSALERAAACSSPGVELAEALRRLAGVLRSTDGVHAAVAGYESALEHAADNPQLRASIHQALGWMRCFQGSVEGTRFHATAALAAIEEMPEPDPAMLMEVLSSVAESQFHAGLDEYRETMERALLLEREHPRAAAILDRPSGTRASHLIREDDLDTARSTFEELYKEALETSDEPARIESHVFLGTIAAYEGESARALDHLDAAHLGAVQSGQEATECGALAWRTLAHTQLGNVDAARADAAAALRIATAGGSVWLEARVRGHLGLLELSLGNAEAARESLDVASARFRDTGVREPGSFHIVPDHVEALVALGELDRAEEEIKPFEYLAHDRRRAWALAGAERARALLVAARGDLDQAIVHAENAADAFAELPYRLDRHRSEMVTGSIYRRAKQKRLARDWINRAIAGFDDMSAPLWAARAREDLARISGRTAGGLELTETERQVAELVCDGLTNQQIADRLFMSARTVESNLSKVYRKRQVRSRVELVQQLRTSPQR